MKPIDVLKMYEAWEADLILRDDCEVILNSLPDDMYNRLIEIQGFRNEAVKQLEKEDGEAWLKAEMERTGGYVFSPGY